MSAGRDSGYSDRSSGGVESSHVSILRRIRSSNTSEDGDDSVFLTQPGLYLVFFLCFRSSDKNICKCALYPRSIVTRPTCPQLYC